MTQTLTQLAELADALSPYVTLLYAPIDPRFESGRWEQERAIAERLLSTHFGEVCTIAHRIYGAPFILRRPHQAISISHCEDLMVIALAKEGYRVGIDIERRSEQVAKVLPRVCSPMELTELGTYPQDGDLKASLLWGAKEAVYKVTSPTVKSLLSLHLLRLGQEGEQSYSLDIAAKESQAIYRVDCLALPRHMFTLVCVQEEA